jgi:hypothetical protein
MAGIALIGDQPGQQLVVSGLGWLSDSTSGSPSRISVVRQVKKRLPLFLYVPEILRHL